MYATLANFIDTFSEEELIQLTNLTDPSATTINTAVLEANQIKAKALINGMIASNSGLAAQMPFPTAPALLTNYELDITRYYLDRNAPREDVRLRYEDAMAQLRLIGQGKLSIGFFSEEVAPVEPSGGGSISFDSNDSLFSSGFLEGY